MAQNLAMDILRRRVAEQPDDDFLRFREQSYSYAEFAVAYQQLAAGLAGINVARQDIVAVFFPNSGKAVETWFALMHLGAIWAPVNTQFRGQQLSRALELMESATLIVDAPFLEHVIEALPGLSHVQRIVVNGADELPEFEGIEFICLQQLVVAPIPDAALPDVLPIERREVAMIQFTSGSTGVSKAVQLSHGYLLGQAEALVENFEISRDDVLYCPYPLYHWDAAIGTVMAALCSGCTAALARKFSVSDFWSDIHFFGATVFDFMGATLTFVYQLPEKIDDAQNPVRLAWGIPMPEFKNDFEQRFKLKLSEGYGSTEGGVSIFQLPGKTYPPGSCGEVANGWSLRLVNDNDQAVACGEVGEIVIRPDDATQIMNGYLKMPETNAELIRDGWYYSGDLGRLDEAGNLYFAGRKKDIIRRRGENISALEIETVIGSHPSVSEVAAYGLASKYTEEEVAVAVVILDGKSLSQEQIIEYCDGKMAHYMAPEHVMFLQQLPKTATEKVAKAELKKWHMRMLVDEVNT